jgi:hypothetical protein
MEKEMIESDFLSKLTGKKHTQNNKSLQIINY